jgi:hypothetical protein
MNPVRAWNAFWFRPVSARPLGAFRVVMGLLVIAHLGLLWVDLDYWLTDRGLLQGAEARLLAGPYRPSPLQWVQDPVSVRAFFAATGAVALAFTLGWRTRVMGVLLYLMLLAIHHRNILANCGADNLLLIMVFYLMLSPCGAAYSLDARRVARRRGAPAEPLIVPWAQRLVQVHLSLIYFNTAVLKSAGTTWLGGTALHFVLHNREVGARFDLSFLAQYPVLVNVMTIAALLAEFALAFLLWFQVTRPWMIATGLALHGFVLLVVNVPLFGELTTACYLTFLTPGELDAALRAVDLKRWLGRKPLARSVPAPSLRADGPEGLRGAHVSAASGATPVAAELPHP